MVDEVEADLGIWVERFFRYKEQVGFHEQKSKFKYFIYKDCVMDKRFSQILILVFLMAACGKGGENTAIPSQTEVASIAATPCPTYASKTIYPINYSPMLIYVLVEGTQSYGDLMPRSFEIMAEILPGIVEPEDRIIQSFMEYFDKEIARIFNDEVETVAFPNYSYTPLITPTLATMEPIATAQGTFGNYVQTTSVKATQVEYNNILTRVSNEHNCVQDQEEANNMKLFNEWENKRKAAIEEFVANYIISTSEVNLDELPEITNPIRAISQTSEIFDLFCTPDSFQKCYLIIFSNMTGSITNSPETDGLDLEGVNVLVVLQQCTFLSDCSNTVKRWDDYFSSLNAASIHFIPNGDEIELLNKYLVR